jgi:hypothetical protein
MFITADYNYKLPADYARPAPLTGNFSRLSTEARIAVTLRLLHGNLPITEFMIARAAYLCTARRAEITKHLRLHRNLGGALAKAFMGASTKDRAVFVRAIGCEEILDVLT